MCLLEMVVFQFANCEFYQRGNPQSLMIKYIYLSGLISKSHFFSSVHPQIVHSCHSIGFQVCFFQLKSSRSWMDPWIIQQGGSRKRLSLEVSPFRHDGVPPVIIHFERWAFPWNKPSSYTGVPPPPFACGIVIFRSMLSHCIWVVGHG